MRIDCTSNQFVIYQGEGQPGGRNCRVAQYAIVCLQSSGGDVVLSLDLDHGPNGQQYDAHSAPIQDWEPGKSLPRAKVGDADTSKILGEWLRISAKIKSKVQGQAQWALIEIWETRKPF